MSFSDVFRTERDICKFSYDGKYVAYAFQNNVFVRNARSNRIIRSFPAVDVVQYIEWAPDSKFILCALYQRGIVQILSLQFPKWKCKIREGEVGIKRALWSPDSRHVLTVGKFNVWVCIWSLTDLSVKYISNLKSTVNPVLEFSNDGKWLGVLEKHEKCFCVSTFSTASWHLSKRFPCDKIEIVGGLLWSTDSETICIWDKRVDICRVLLISLLCDSMFIFEKNALGVHSISWSPSGQFLALGCCDGKVRLLNYITWNEMYVLNHINMIDSKYCSVYKEILVEDSCKIQMKKNTDLLPHQTIFKEVAVRPVFITFESKNASNGLCYKTEVWLNGFSFCGQFLVTTYFAAPATLWIWNVKCGILHTFLSFNKPIVDVAWDPCSLRLAAASESNNICLWTPANGASVVHTPESELWDVRVSGIKWHPNGHTLALNSKNVMTLLWFSGEADLDE